MLLSHSGFADALSIGTGGKRSINNALTKEEREKRGTVREKIYYFFSLCLMWGYDWREAVRRLLM